MCVLCNREKIHQVRSMNAQRAGLLTSNFVITKSKESIHRGRGTKMKVVHIRRT